MAWLEGLASKHGAKPEELVTDPNARTEVAPDWVDKAKAIGEAPVAESLAGPGAETPEDETGIWLKGLREQGARSKASEWIGEFDEPAQQGAAVESNEPAFPLNPEPAQAPEPEAAPPAAEWLSGLQSMGAGMPGPSPEETAPAEALPAASLPDWLSGLDDDKPVAAPSEELPAWLADEMASEQPAAVPTRASDWKPVDMGGAVQQPAQPMQEPEFEPVQPKQEAAPPPAPTSVVEAEKPAQAAARPRPAEGAAASKEAGLSGPRAEMGRGNIAAALEEYGRMIRKGKFLDEIIFDLREAIYRYPVEVPVWQALGDAYMRANRLQEALDAYTKAEELLR
jgi:hypothetical protein